MPSYSYIQQYSDFLDQVYDHRIEHYPLMGKPYKILTVAISYLIFVKIIGPKWMETRKPYDLTRIMPIYNALQVILNISFALYGIPLLWNEKFHFSCPISDYNTTELGYKLVNFGYYFFALKVFDLMDTIFIVLKKNYRQATILHIYHHTIMAVATQIVVQHYPGGVYILPGILNSIVHIVMYFYFLLTTIKPELKKSSWWKKYITQMQMLQFLINMYHYWKTITNDKCDLPNCWTWWGISQNIIFLVLFLNFYIKSYNAKNNKKHIKNQ